MQYHRLILENYSRMAKMVYHRLAPENISIGQPKVLDYLLEKGECVQRDIAKACFIEPASVTSILAKMEKDGYIVRCMHEDNRRFLHIRLTELGREKALLVKEFFLECEQMALEGLNEQEQEEIHRLLEKINQNLAKQAEE